MSRNHPSIVRPVTNREWIDQKFLPGIFAFSSRPENRGLRVDLRGIGDACIRLLDRDEIPNGLRVAGLGRRLLRGIREKSHTLRTSSGFIVETPTGLNLTLMTNYGSPLRDELKGVRSNLAHLAALRKAPEVPTSAYGIVLARFGLEMEPEQRVALEEIATSIRPQNVIVGEAQPLFERR